MASRVGTHIKRHRSRRDWTEIPYDITASILSRLDGDTESLAAAEMVCKTWREICKDPKLWRTIDFHSNRTIYMLGPPRRFDIVKMCRHAIHRSSGSFINVNVDYFCKDELLKYITNSSAGFIRHLSLFNCNTITDEALCEAALRLPLLEELDLSMCKVYSKSLEVVGRCCPLLKSFKFNNRMAKYNHRWYYDRFDDKDAIAISETMHGLRLLAMQNNELSCNGLEKILDSCPQLQILDLRKCQKLKKMSTELEIRCVERIKKLWLPSDPCSESAADLNMLGKPCN
ncbi:PREDICTED: F-box protein SKIP19-like [Fragaria vesca subsp. vesca]|uniref:F-box protein SKIP19-like n=1 Tax=Fragaria vesca subsp. vesca TaxID=101020 RepID=UPI0002C34E14|nr:PREDICTED: F-box protein SKIP19-like [Fragaria vesca subsp. vesca]